MYKNNDEKYPMGNSLLKREWYLKYRKLIIIGIVVHLITALFSVGYYHVDEHFQVLEFTSLKLGLTEEENLPWEYQALLRPSLQPAIAFILIKAVNIVNLDNPFFHAALLRFISAILSLSCVYLLICSLYREIRSDFLIKWFIFLSLFIWFLPYLHVRFSSENWSGIFFWIGFAMIHMKSEGGKNSENSHLRSILKGMVLGIAFVLRFQIGLLIGGYFLWLLFIKKEKWSTVFLLSSGVVLFILVGILIDYWYYGEWTLTAWNYFKVNLLEGKTSEFGLEPWWFYIEEIVVKGVPPFSVVIVLSALLVWIKYPKHAITWITIPYIAIHSLIGHKELRFLFSLIYIVPFLFVLFLQFIQEDQKLSKVKNWLNVLKKPILLLFLIINSILVFVLCIKPADMHIYLYQHVYNTYDPEKTEIISIGRGPYSRAVPVNFYKKKEFRIKTFTNEKEIIDYISITDKKLLYATKKPELFPDLKDFNCPPVYQNLPPGVKYYNINNWVERTPFWTLYECKGGMK
jgi:phosphatidylinositol glycan class B